MSATPDVLDLTDFPIVRWRPPRYGAPQRAARIRAGLDHLLSLDRPFAMVMPLDPDVDDEPLADRQDRNAWYGEHGARYFALQQAAVWIEPDRAKWPALEELAAKLRKAVRTPIALAATEEEAVALARRMFAAAA